MAQYDTPCSPSADSGLGRPQHRGAVASACGIVVACSLSVPAADAQDPPIKSKSSDDGDAEEGSALVSSGGTALGLRLRLANAGRHALQEAAAVAKNREFWKFMTMCLFTVNLKSIFRHLDATLPKYQIRIFGCAAPVGLVYSINPFMIIFLVPIVGALTTHANHFDMIHLGGYVSALAPFWMVAFSAEWATMLFVVFLSLGEAIWSPRWYDYSMSVAPDGREGIWTALASAPLFAAKLPTGMISGKLLQTLCPAPGACPAEMDSTAALGQSKRGASFTSDASLRGGGAGAAAIVQACDGRTMWLIISLITLTSPVAIFLTQRWVRPAPPTVTMKSNEGSLQEGWDYREGLDPFEGESETLRLLTNPARGGREQLSDVEMTAHA